MHYLWLLHRKEMFRPVNANEQNEFPNCPVGCLCWFWVTVTRTPPSICDPVWVQLDNIDTCGGNVSIAEQFWHVRCWLPLNLNLWLRSVKIMMMRVGVGGVRHPQHTQTSSNSSTIAASSSNGVTNTRCCRYSCLRSWWWVKVLPETCRAVSRYK